MLFSHLPSVECVSTSYIPQVMISWKCFQLWVHSDLLIFRKWIWKEFRWAKKMACPISVLKFLSVKLSSRNKMLQIALTWIPNWGNWRENLTTKVHLHLGDWEVDSRGSCFNLPRCLMLWEPFPIPISRPILLPRMPSEKYHEEVKQHWRKVLTLPNATTL